MTHKIIMYLLIMIGGIIYILSFFGVIFILIKKYNRLFEKELEMNVKPE